MFQVLMVDDELLVRNDLRSLISWESNGFSVCGEAVDGQSGLRLVRSLLPDIVIVDMHMPSINGIELIRHIKKEFPYIQVIALSSFDNYDYVRSAMGLGAVDYLLKHRLRADELLKVLQMAAGKIEQGKLWSKVKRQAEQWEKVVPAVRGLELKEWLIGRSESPPFVASELRGAKITLIALQVPLPSRLGSGSKMTAIEDFQSKVEDLLVQALLEEETAQLCVIGKLRFAVVLTHKHGRSERAMLEKTSGLAERLCRTLKMLLGVNPDSRYTDSPQDMHGLPPAYAALTGLHQEQISSSSKDVSMLSIAEEKQLLTLLETAGDEGIRHYTEQVLDSGLPPEEQAFKAEEITAIVNKALAKLRIDHVQFLPADGPFIQDSKQPLADMLMTAVVLIREQQLVTGETSHVRAATRYILSQYTKSISLEHVAEHVGVSASYLSRLFREELHQSFPEYLNRRRVEAAKQLLMENSGTVKDVYARVGFNQFSYFIKVFKDLVGVTPSEYARRGRDEQGS